MNTKILISFVRTLLFVAIMGLGLSMASGVLSETGQPVIEFAEAAAMVLGAVMLYHLMFSDVLRKEATGSLFAGVQKELWLDVLTEGFYRVGSFLNNVMDWSAFVDNHTLNFADAGGDPTVLVDNTSYPIATNQRTDTAKTIDLQTYDTENTRVRNVEEIEAAYNKLDSVIRQHRNALIQATHDRAIHAYGPSADGANTPILLTTGTATADHLSAVSITGTFKKFTIADIAALKMKFDLNDWPQTGRCLVIHPLHQMDLINEDAQLFKAFARLQTGEIFELYGFKILPYTATPVYTEATGAKKAFGAAAAAAADTISSVAFLETEVMKADGDLEMFYLPKSQNTGQRADEIGFQKRFVAAQIRGVGVAAVISDRTA